MNKYLISFVVFLTSYVTLFAQNSESAEGAEIFFPEQTFDFGDIAQGEVVEHIFEFENTGEEPLLLTNITTTCGCTASNWPRDPIAPGEKEEIKITFNSTGKMGLQNKVITVFSNASNPQERIKIVANVLRKEG